MRIFITKRSKINAIVLLLLLSVFSGFGYNIPAIADTSKKHLLDVLASRAPKETEYKINRGSYYLSYGFDATAKQIINSFFKKRTIYFCFIFSNVFLLFFAFLLSFITIISLSGLLQLFLFFLFYLIFLTLRIYGIVKLIQDKKIDLLYQLIEYRKTGNSPFGKKPTPNNKPNDSDYYQVK